MERITTINELLTFLEVNYDILTNKEYQTILRSTLHVYVGNKPQKHDALLKIEKHYEFISQIPQGYELPLFFVDEI